MPRTRPLVLAAAALAALLCAPATRADTLVLEPVAVQGQLAPEGGRFLLFGDVDVDPLRRVTITASLSGGQVGIFRTSFGVLVPIVMSGDPAPPDAGNNFFVPLGVASNRRGDLAFISTTFFPDRVSLFLRRDEEIVTLARQGDPAPGHAGLWLGGFVAVRIQDSGEVFVIADFVDDTGSIVGRSLLAHDGLALRAVMAPGDRYGGTRAVASVLQYDVNETGEVAALVAVQDAEFLLDTGLSEIVLLSGGSVRTLASAFLSLTGNTDDVRHFAVADDQVSLDAAGEVSFFVATNNFPGGGYALNTTGRLFENTLLVREGQVGPVSATDRYTFFGSFGRAADGLMAFHAVSTQAPGGMMAVRLPGGPDVVLARPGTPRPGGGIWSGFRRVRVNRAGVFAFTEFGGLFQLSVFQGRRVPSALQVLEAIAAALESPDLEPSVARSLAGVLRSLERAVRAGDIDRATRAAGTLQQALELRAGRSIPLLLAEELDALLDDLAIALVEEGQAASTEAAPDAGLTVPDGSPRIIESSPSQENR